MSTWESMEEEISRRAWSIGKRPHEAPIAGIVLEDLLGSATDDVESSERSKMGQYARY